MDKTETSPLLQIYRALFVSLLLVNAASLAVLIAIFGHAEWHSNLLRFAARVWHVFVTYNAGSTSPGFVSSILFSLLGVVVLAIYIAHTKGKKALKQHMIESFALAVFGIITVVFVVYGTQFAWEVAKVGYEDHKTLAVSVISLKGEESHMVDPVGRDSTIADLSEQLRESQSQLASRKQMLHVGDPAFQNMTNTIRAFMTWRRNIGYDSPCKILVTTPDKEDGGLYMTFITFAVFGATCANGDLNNVGVKPENIEAETDKGMIPGVIVFHAPPDAKGANQLQTELENLFQIKRAFTIPGNAPANTIWLQFGPGVKWNTEKFSKTNEIARIPGVGQKSTVRLQKSAANHKFTYTRINPKNLRTIS
jgi:hypothetical protein